MGPASARICAFGCTTVPSPETAYRLQRENRINLIAHQMCYLHMYFRTLVSQYDSNLRIKDSLAWGADAIKCISGPHRLGRVPKTCFSQETRYSVSNCSYMVVGSLWLICRHPMKKRVHVHFSAKSTFRVSFFKKKDVHSRIRDGVPNPVHLTFDRRVPEFPQKFGKKNSNHPCLDSSSVGGDLRREGADDSFDLGAIKIPESMWGFREWKS